MRDEQGSGAREPDISLDEEQTRALEHLAAKEGISLAELVRRAVDAYLAERFRTSKSWGERLGSLIARIRARVPSDVPPEEIEADITRARQEVREERQAGLGAADVASG